MTILTEALGAYSTTNNVDLYTIAKLLPIKELIDIPYNITTNNELRLNRIEHPIWATISLTRTPCATDWLTCIHTVDYFNSYCWHMRFILISLEFIASPNYL